MPSLTDITALLNISPRPVASREITGVASLLDASANDLSFITSDSYLKDFNSSRAAVVLVGQRVKLPPNPRPIILHVEDAELALAKVLHLFAPPIARPPVGIDPAARVAPDAVLGDGVAIAPHVVIGRRCRVGPGTVLHAGVFIGDDVVIGESCEIFPNVVIRERITLGQRVIIHAGSILGSDGFGYRWDGTQHVKIPQIGTIEIESDVEIGSCVCIDRAKIGVTKIGHGTKIDNLVQIAHNCVIGPNCIIVGQTGLAGSVTLGANVVLGGQTAVRDHITIGDAAMSAACSAIAEDVPPKTIVSGMPAFPHRQSLREQAALRRLPDLVAQVRKLQEELNTLKLKKGDRSNDDAEM